MNKTYQEYATLFEKPVLLTALKYNSLAFNSIFCKHTFRSYQNQINKQKQK